MTITRPPRRALAVATALLAGAAAIVVIFPGLVGLSDRLPFTGLVAFRPAIAAGTAAVAVLWLVAVRRGRVAAATLLVVCGAAVALLVPRAFPDGPGGATPGARELTLVSANVYEGRADIGDLARLVRERRPDLIVLPESAQRFRDRLAAAIGGLGYRSYVAGAPGVPDVHGTTVFAAARLGDLRPRVLPMPVDPWLELTGGSLGRTRLVAVHVAAPVPDKIASWGSELASLPDWCASGGDIVLAGDFNATLDHDAFRSGTAGCTDAAEVAGRGLVATWPQRWPRWFGAQIDHVLTAGAVTSVDLEVLPQPGSDHRLVMARIALPAA